MDPEETLEFKPEADLDEIIATYLKLAQAGSAPKRKELIARYPTFAQELAEFFTDQERFQRVAKPVREAVTGLPLLGTRIRYFGDYELLEEIGRGGMGVVYKARQVSLNRTVALKMILTGELANETDVKRFHAEAEAAAKLDHPGIVPIFEVGQHEGHHYFTMAFVESESLAHKIVQGLPPPRQAAELIRKVAEAVAYAHVEGVIHRDLKPANILIDRNGQPRLTDFGLAKRWQTEPGASAAAGLTATGQILGTPSYMPPEQASGRHGAVGPVSDVYALGAVLYCLLTGRPPFQAANPLDTLLQVLDSEPVRPRQLNAAVPRDLETICLKCLHKEPRKRYASAQDLVRDLERYLGGQPILARPTGPGERFGKWVKRRPAAAALLLLGGMVALGLPLLLGALLQNAEERAQAVQDLTQAQRDLDAARQETAGQQELAGEAQAHLNTAKEDLLSVRHQVDRQNQLVLEAMFHSKGLRLIGQSSALRVSNPGLALLLAIEGQKLAPGLMANNALREAIAECREERTIPAPYASRSAIYSPDGKLILSLPALNCSHTQPEPARLWDPATGAPVAELAVPPISITSATFSPDSKRIVFTFNQHNRIKWYNKLPEIIYTDRVVRVWDVGQRKEIAILKGHKSRIVSAQFSPDGQKLVTASWDGTVRNWDTGTWKEDRVIAAHEAGATAAVFSPDGRSILTASTSFTHQRSEDVELHKVKNALLDPPARTLPPGVKPGDLPMSSGYGSTASGRHVAEKIAVTIWDAGTGNLRRALQHGSKGMHPALDLDPPFFPLAWNAKGNRVLTWSPGVSNSLTLWDTATGEACVTLPTGFLAHVLFSPDGTRVLTVSDQRRKLSLWDASTGKEVLAIPVSEGLVEAPTFSPDGRWILCACGDKAARTWSADTGEVHACFRGHQVRLGTATFSPDATRVVTASADGTLRIWNPQPGRGYPFILYPAPTIKQVAFSSNGRRLATGGSQAAVWDSQTGQGLHTLRGLASLANSPVRQQILGETVSVEFSSDGRRLLVATKEGLARIRKPTLFGFGREIEEEVPFTPVRLFDVENGKEILGFRGPRGEIGQAAFSPNGKLVLAAENGPQNMRIFSLTGGQMGGSSGTIADGQAYIWEAATGKLIQTLKGHVNGITCCVWSPDSKRVLTADYSNGSKANDGAARLWDIETGKTTLTLEGDRGGVRLAAFRPDGKHVLLLRGGWHPAVEIWDTTTGYVTLVLGPSQSGHAIKYWDAQKKDWVPTRKGLIPGAPPGSEKVPVHTSDVTYAAYSPDGRRIVTASSYKTARIWDAATGKHLLVLRGHILGLNHAAFSADSKRVVTSSEDETARVWDAQTGEEIFTLAGHKAAFLSAVFSPDGKYVATASADGTARIWPLDPVSLALSRKPRELSPEERERFGIGEDTKPQVDTGKKCLLGSE